MVSLTTTPARRVALAALVALFFYGAAATPALAQHRARLSADLADHLAAGSQSIDVIVHSDQVSADEIARRYGVVIKRRMKTGAVLRVNAGQLDALSRDEDLDHLSGDVRIRASDVTTRSIGADQLWDGGEDLPNLTGEGIVVGVIDSGMDLQHNALKGHVKLSVDFTGGNGFDKYGHGTHVAATIAGVGGRTADTRDYRGVAPNASLINLRVLDDIGSGLASDVIEAIDWAIEHRAQYKIRILNLSIGAPVLQPYRDDPLCEAVERAVRAGMVVVVAAGNFGQTAEGLKVAGGITSPGISPHAITVGAVDTHGTPWRSDDTLAPYSSIGPTRFDLVLKPDLVAPGSHIVSAEAAGSYLATTLSQRHVTGSGKNAFIQLSGTSMATAVVSGAVALLLQEKPTLRPATTKMVLQLTSSFMPSAGLMGGGAGSLNALAAAQLVAEGPNQSLPTTKLAGEQVTSSGVFFGQVLLGRDAAKSSVVLWGDAAKSSVILWGDIAKGNLILWGDSARSSLILWGDAAQSNVILWGDTAKGNLILWGDAVGSDLILWGDAVVADLILWGDTIVNDGLDP